MFNDVNLELGTLIHYVAENHVHVLAFVTSVIDQQHVSLVAFEPTNGGKSGHVLFAKAKYDQDHKKLHTWHLPEDV